MSEDRFYCHDSDGETIYYEDDGLPPNLSDDDNDSDTQRSDDDKKDPDFIPPHLTSQRNNNVFPFVSRFPLVPDSSPHPLHSHLPQVPIDLGNGYHKKILCLDCQLKDYEILKLKLEIKKLETINDSFLEKINMLRESLNSKDKNKDKNNV